MAASLTAFSTLHTFPRIGAVQNKKFPNFAIISQSSSNSKNESRGGRRIWRRRKLTKKDETMDAKMERIPFLEEQVRKIRDGGKLLKKN